MQKGEEGTQERRVLTTQEVADVLKVRVETVRSYIKRGWLPAVKLGRDYRIAAEDVQRLLQPRLGEAGVTYQIEPQIRQGMMGIAPAEVAAVDLPPAEPVGDHGGIAPTAAEFDVWAVTEQFGEEAAPYDPEAARWIEELFREIGPEIRKRYPTIKEFMESTRGRGSHDPD